eukprot:GHVU01042862.1.p1 GENE.GHVU01042862.1~~GHVU01042862.1.p1  ORF type:complete len:144 (+),score=9.07 GHVU01042862.1:584-1015(+)
MPYPGTVALSWVSGPGDTSMAESGLLLDTVLTLLTQMSESDYNLYLKLYLLDEDDIAGRRFLRWFGGDIDVIEKDHTVQDPLPPPYSGFKSMATILAAKLREAPDTLAVFGPREPFVCRVWTAYVHRLQPAAYSLPEKEASAR